MAFNRKSSIKSRPQWLVFALFALVITLKLSCAGSQSWDADSHQQVSETSRDELKLSLLLDRNTNQDFCKYETFDSILDCDHAFDYSLENNSNFANIDRDYAASMWRWRYSDEPIPKFRVLVHDKSIDSRFANLGHSSMTTRLFDMDPHAFRSGDEQVDREVEDNILANSKYDDEKCGQHLRMMLDQMQEVGEFVERQRQNPQNITRMPERYIMLAYVMDTFGRLESAALLGKNMYTGSFEQCLHSQLILNASTPEVVTGTRFCWARLKLHKHLHPSMKPLTKSVLKAAVCLPETCHSRSFRQHKQLLQELVNSQFKFPKTFYIDEHLELGGLFCLPDAEGIQIPFAGKLFVTVMAIWSIGLIYATLMDSRPAGEAITLKDQILNALNVMKSFDDFVSPNKKVPGRVDLDVLNPVKVLGCAFVVLGHSLMTIGTLSMDPLKTLSEVENSPVTMAIFSGTIIVDTFSVITGLIMTYIGLKTLYSKGIVKRINSLGSFLSKSFGIFLTRYLRLVPMYFLLFWFKRSLFIYLGNSAIWDYGYDKDTVVGSCARESWLSPLIGMSSYLPMSKQCLPQLWSVASDILYSIILAPLIILLAKRPKIAVFLALVLSLFSYNALSNAIKQVPEPVLSEFKSLRIHAFTYVFRTMSHLYSGAQYRVGSILVGALAGYILYRYDAPDGIKQWPKWFKGPVTYMALFTVLGMVSAVPITLAFPRDTRRMFQESLFDSVWTYGRFSWCVYNSVIFLRMVTDWKDSYLMKNCSAIFWRTMAKLNYVILLVHLDMLYLNLMYRVSTTLYSQFQLLQLFACTYMICLAVAVPIYVLLENPIDKLVKVLTAGAGNAAFESVKETKKESLVSERNSAHED